MTDKDIDKVVWWVPFKKTRESLRNILQSIQNNIVINKNIENNIISVSTSMQNQIKYLEYKLELLDEKINEYNNIKVVTISFVNLWSVERGNFYYYKIDLLSKILETILKAKGYRLEYTRDNADIEICSAF